VENAVNCRVLAVLLLALVSSRVLATDHADDFDFSLGTWRTQISWLRHPLSEAAAWVDMEGIAVVRSARHGIMSFETLAAESPEGRFDVFAVRLYDAATEQWSLSYSSPTGALGLSRPFNVPTVGALVQGRVELIDTNAFDGRSVRVRNAWFDITADSYRFEQAVSRDGGRTWKACWTATYTRMNVTAPMDDADTEKMLRMP
jgi:hypothetical protein